MVRRPASSDGCTPSPPDVRSADRDLAWQRGRRWARALAWASLGWMTLEGVAGLVAGTRAGSVSLTGWALGPPMGGSWGVAGAEGS